MKYDFLIFGGTGQQGRICSKDLLDSGYSVMIVGRDTSKIGEMLKNKKAGFIKADLRKASEISAVIKKSGADVVVNCAELIFNISVMQACLKEGKSVTDLGGLQDVTKQQFKLHAAFAKKGILNITGCGSTPGISNVMVKYAADKLDTVDTIYLGFAWDSNIKKFAVPYSIQSIFDELTQDPVTFHSGKFVKEKRMACGGAMDFKKVGRQNVYCIVHSEVYSFPKYLSDKKLKTIHYLAGFPEHSLNPIEMLIELGFNSSEKIKINGAEVMPREFTTAVLKKLPFPKGYKEVENIWANIYGKKDGKKKLITMNCLVETQKGWEEAGSNIDTGRTISIISQMIKKGLIHEKGVYAPEGLVPQDVFFRELAKRKMYVYENNRRIN
jgi:saccharopine dehydrogenase-like NADP-dependent oxidoreductase